MNFIVSEVSECSRRRLLLNSLEMQNVARLQRLLYCERPSLLAMLHDFATILEPAGHESGPGACPCIPFVCAVCATLIAVLSDFTCATVIFVPSEFAYATLIGANCVFSEACDDFLQNGHWYYVPYP